MAKNSAKTEYTDPTSAEHPPGGKHHKTDADGTNLPTDRPGEKPTSAGKKSVDAETASKTER